MCLVSVKHLLRSKQMETSAGHSLQKNLALRAQKNLNGNDDQDGPPGRVPKNHGSTENKKKAAKKRLSSNLSSTAGWNW
jgi:hypothetical protein